MALIYDKHLAILKNNQLNRSTAYDKATRARLKITGALPPAVENLDKQLQRAYFQYKSYASDIHKYIFLEQLFNTNCSLYFSLISAHLEEMLPVIYTPTVSEAVKNYSKFYSQPEGLIISYPQIDNIDQIFENITNKNIKIAVVTDGSAVLGIGDQGVGGIKIATGKLAVYTLCSGIDPFETLAIHLDTGTDNENLLKDPLYLGWRNNRIDEHSYNKFLDKFIDSFKKHLPNTLLHWEDFDKKNARILLNRYKDYIPSFNDDIQGTGAIATAAAISAIKKSDLKTQEHRFCIFGAGTAGTGIADQICYALSKLEKTTIEDIQNRFYLIDSSGLISPDSERIMSFQKPYAKKLSFEQGVSSQKDLINLLSHEKPTVLIGCSAVKGAFTPEVLNLMKSNAKRPIIMILSNPTSSMEATVEEILQHTEGQALVVTGSPVENVFYKDLPFKVSQCNNALVFPGLARGMILSKAKKLTDDMLLAASSAICQVKTTNQTELLPSISQVNQVSEAVAVSVAKQAQVEGVSDLKLSAKELQILYQKSTWQPENYL